MREKRGGNERGKVGQEEGKGRREERGGEEEKKRIENGEKGGKEKAFITPVQTVTEHWNSLRSGTMPL